MAGLARDGNYYVAFVHAIRLRPDVCSVKRQAAHAGSESRDVVRGGPFHNAAGASSLLTLIREMTYLLRASLRWLFSLVLILIGVLYVLFWPDRLAVLVRSIWIDVKLLASLIHTRVESARAFAVSYVRTFWRL
jgi:hypothetical protein